MLHQQRAVCFEEAPKLLRKCSERVDGFIDDQPVSVPAPREAWRWRKKAKQQSCGKQRAVQSEILEPDRAEHHSIASLYSAGRRLSELRFRL
jgi:hypothetical protein